MLAQLVREMRRSTMEAAAILARTMRFGVIARLDLEGGVVYFLDGCPSSEQGEAPQTLAARHLPFFQAPLRPLGFARYKTESDDVVVYDKIRARPGDGGNGERGG